jgi:3-methylfumaryl-CoA hydratase
VSCVQETQTIVYRGVGGAPAEVPRAPVAADFSHTWSLDSTALFRYSALTFNGHRIHYDADYARDVEGYSGLVIHGPLLATLLMNLAEDCVGPLRSFDYRARSPLCLPDKFTVNGRRGADSAELWAASLDGRLAMTATASFQDGTTP